MPLRIHVLVRFGRWEELIAEPLPADPELYCTTAATIHYGRGVAHASKGQLPQARAEREAFAAAYDRIPETRYLFNNTSRDILAIAAAMLDGEIAYRDGEFEEAFGSPSACDRTRRRAAIRRTVGLDAADPARLRSAAARTRPRRGGRGGVRRRPRAGSTLSRPCQHPGNVWSLHGYHECLQRLGRAAEAAIIGQQLDLLRARADVPIHASCACRLEVA